MAILQSLIFLCICIIGTSHTQSCNECKFPKMDPCQKAAVRENQEYVDSLTPENVASFNVELYKKPIVILSDKQYKYVKKYFKKFFTYTEQSVIVGNRNETEETSEVSEGYDVHNVSNGVVVDSNGTCTTVTRTSPYDRYYNLITSTTKCHGTDPSGSQWMTQQSRSRYELIRTRNKRQIRKTALCKGVAPSAGTVSFTVNSDGVPVQSVPPIDGGGQFMGHEACALSSAAPSNIICEREFIEAPSLVFNLKRKRMIAEDVKLPQCVAYVQLS